MNYFIVGDVHGCYYTLKDLLDNYWNPQNEKLILLGDIVNKGKHTFAVLEYLMNLKKKHPKQLLLLKGNNEYLFEKYYRDSITLAAKQKFENYNLDYIQVLNWLDQLPHFWENGVVFVSHAGIPFDGNLPLTQDELDVLFNRKKIKNINKLQFVGHVVKDQPIYDTESNTWYIDTGAGYGKLLTGVKISNKGKIISWHLLPVHRKDISRLN